MNDRVVAFSMGFLGGVICTVVLWVIISIDVIGV